MEPTYSVSELSRVIARALARALPDEVWVEGEIRDLSRSRQGHVYFTLVDPAAASDQAPLLPVSLFASDRAAVNRILVRSGAMRMTDGVHVRIRGRIGHYATRGTVQLRMTWIDTDYTVGKLAAARRALLRKLELSGDLTRNAGLVIPSLPLRIGLITSIGSAAHADFLTGLQGSGYGFAVTVADARVQGTEAEASIVAALQAMAEAAPDVVAVVRGGGAQTDLAAFDTEGVARAIARAPFPVLTGIGHEVDTTVADHVAAASFKTPTACAQYIVSNIEDAISGLSDAQRRVVAAATAALRRSDHRMSGAAVRVASGSGLHLRRHEGAVERAAARLDEGAVAAPQRARRRLRALVDRIGVAAASQLAGDAVRIEERARRLAREAGRALAAAERRINALGALQRAHAPERMLARGWSVTYGAEGRPLRDPAETATGDRIRTRLLGGDIVSIVDEVQEGASS